MTKSPFNIQVEGMQLVKRIIDELPDVFSSAADMTTERFADMIVEEATRIVPVDTGYLRSTLGFVKLKPMEYVILAYSHYAHYVEFGTYKMKAQPYLRPAIHKYLPQYVKAMRDQAILDSQSLISRLISRIKRWIGR